MKKIIMALLSIIFLSSCSMHSKTPNISIKTSAGIRYKGHIYFLVKYSVYFRPTGLAKFPDGGSSVFATGGIYLMSYLEDKKLLKSIHKIDIKGAIPFVEYTKFSLNNNILTIYMKYYPTGKSNLVDLYYNFNIDDNTISEVKIKDFTHTQKNIIKSSEIIKYFDHIFDYSELGLPDPMNHVKRDDKALKKMILSKSINKRFKLAVLGYIIKKNKYYILEELKREEADEETKKIIESIPKNTENQVKTKE